MLRTSLVDKNKGLHGDLGHVEPINIINNKVNFLIQRH
jgi:hypothetical protein